MAKKKKKKQPARRVRGGRRGGAAGVGPIAVGGAASLDTAAAPLVADNVRRQSAAPADRMRYALAVTRAHFDIDADGAFDVSIRESLDEAFEQQETLNALNLVQGPFVQHDSGNAFRWLPMIADDLDDLNNVGDFVRLVFAHIVPAAA